MLTKVMTKCHFMFCKIFTFPIFPEHLFFTLFSCKHVFKNPAEITSLLFFCFVFFWQVFNLCVSQQLFQKLRTGLLHFCSACSTSSWHSRFLVTQRRCNECSVDTTVTSPIIPQKSTSFVMRFTDSSGHQREETLKHALTRLIKNVVPYRHQLR